MDGALAFLYKIWKILRTDRKEVDLDSVEKALREELREELKRIKDENKELKQENNALNADMADLKAAVKICQTNRPSTCPLIKAIRNRGNSSE